MLTVAYARVSTEEQAAEGYSVEGQSERLRSYAELHELGEVMVVSDPGWSGKNLDRPGLQQLLSMVEAGHVQNVLVWRLDRLSRNLGDLILLADRFGQSGVALHSFTEKLDLSSATGRMFYNILGSFAQFYREQLSENVRMGMRQAAREGKWTNRPKFGYDLVQGELVPNDDVPLVREVFRLRATGASYTEIARQTGIHYSTARSIIHSRIYLGEVALGGEWYPGRHEPIITPEAFAAARKTDVPGMRYRSKHPLAGHVRCGICGRVETIHQGGYGTLFRCKHRGTGCKQPARSTKGLERALVLGLRLIGHDEELQAAIRSEIRRQLEPKAEGRRPRSVGQQIASLQEKRRKLLALHYEDKIGADLYAEQEEALRGRIEALQGEESATAEEVARQTDLAERFEEVATLLSDMDIERIWAAATDDEKRVLVKELVKDVTVFPDHLEVSVDGAPRLNVSLEEVGLKSQLRACGVGGGV